MNNNNPGCLGFILKLFGIAPKEEGNKKLPYSQRDDFLSESEFSFYKVLIQAVSDRYVICPKVGLQDIFFVTVKDRSKFTTYLNKINRKHVDFLICEKNTMKPFCAIELDDTSHQRKDRIARDTFINKLYEDAGLPLYRFANKSSYVLNEIKDIILQAPIVNKEIEVEEKTDEKEGNISCKKCGSPMILRTATRGENKGEQFYGCSSYPRCRETIML